MVEFGTNRRNPVTGKSIITKLLTECIHNTICRNDQAGCERMNGMYIIRISLHGIFECHVLNIFQWWSEGTFSLIFSSLLRMSKNEGLWFMSAAQHSLVNLRKIQEKKKTIRRDITEHLWNKGRKACLTQMLIFLKVESYPYIYARVYNKHKYFNVW